MAQWIQKAIFYASANFLKEKGLFLQVLRIFQAGIREYRTSFLKFSSVFLLKSPNLLKFTATALRFFAEKTAKADKSQAIAVFSTKKQKNLRKSAQIPVISLKVETKTRDFFDFLGNFPTNALKKLIFASFTGIFPIFVVIY